jgi:diguanylate cyclase (GGDEF)-like protein
MRRDVELALVSGTQEELRRQSILALEQLCQSQYLERIGVHRINGDIVVDYRRKGGRYNVSVSLPSIDWERYVATGTDPVEVERVPAPPPETESGEAGAPATELLQFVPEITRAFSVSGRADPMLNRLDTLLDTLRQWLGVRGLFLLLDEGIANRTEARGERLKTVTEPELRDNALYRGAIESGERRLVGAAHAGGVADADAPEDWETIGVAPVYALGKVCGVLKMYFGPGFEASVATRRLEAAASVVRQAIEFSSQIETITSVDALTQVYNRHFYDAQVSVEIERAMRSGNEVSMLVIDLDDFKRVNDELGHKKGDEALSAVAELIRRNLRKVDLPFRYGGEEFVILLPGTSEFESVHTAERLRRKVADYRGFKDLHGRPRTITVSIGVSVFPDTATSSEELFDQADAAMYRAKQLGKNRVVLYKKDMKLGHGRPG